MKWKCRNCNREYPDEGKSIKCICKFGGDSKQINELGDSTPWPSHKDCIFLGEFIGKLDCKCNHVLPVYECKVHQICTKRHTVHPWIDFEGNTFPPPKGCSLCQEKQFGPDKPA